MLDYSPAINIFQGLNGPLKITSEKHHRAKLYLQDIFTI